MPYGESFIGSPGLWIYLRKGSGVEHFLTWCVLRLRKNQPSHSIPQRTLTVGGRITVLLVPCLTRIGCDKTRIYVVIVCIEKTKMKKKRTDLAHLKTFLVESKPVKQETSYTVILPLTMSVLWTHVWIQLIFVPFLRKLKNKSKSRTLFDPYLCPTNCLCGNGKVTKIICF